MADSKTHVLVIDNKSSLLAIFRKRLEHLGYGVTTSESGAGGVEIFRRGGVDVVITDLRMPGMDGAEVVRAVRELDPEAIVLIVTAYPTVHSSLDALRYGAEEYFPKPVNFEHLQLVMERALERRRLRREQEERLAALGRRSSLCELVGGCGLMNDVYVKLERAAGSSGTVLLQGETGTGKELAARAIHQLGPRRDGPFIACNCGSMPESLLESELFGHVRGAFTGAHQDKKGLFLAAEGGTILLDEIEAAPPRTQVAFLRVLDRKEIMPVGSHKVSPVDVRVIVTTNRELEPMVASGEFREDLFYRIGAAAVVMPPLRNRADDVPLLVEHFIQDVADEPERRRVHFAKRSLDLMSRYSWPGNVRELRSVVLHEIAPGPEGVVRPEDLPERIRNFRGRPAGGDFKTLLEREREQVAQALGISKGNKAAAARLLGVSRGTLYSLIDKHKLDEGAGAGQ